MKLDIIYEDDDIIVINKPAHILSVPDRFDSNLPNLKVALRKRCGDILVVHRLDKETSGTIVYAKTEESHKHLNEQFREGQTEKRYLALCIHPTENEGTIDNNIAESQHIPGTYTVAKKGKHSISEYKVIESFKKYALIEVKILTGRTHQIRVHMKHIGAPLLTDSKYGVSDKFFLSEIKKYKRKKGVEENPLIYRTSLHAHSLTITHPTTNKSMTFTSDLPKDMRAVLNQFRKVYGDNQ